MDHSTESQTDRKELKKTMSPAEVWALAVGAIIGWGCFVLPGTRFLPDAGPLGTCLAFLIGGGLLCTVALCYSILIKVYPVAGGSFTYAYVGFGTRAGFICGWALVLGYLCVIAANGIKVRIFDELRPTPELSFAVIHYGAQAGINITASHNPREDNG